jgi:amino acid adenylation domain-containing protein
MHSTIVDILRWRALHQAGRSAYTFLVDGESQERSCTYEELDQQARAIAAHLQSLTSTGDRVLLLYPPGLEYIAAFFGCLYAGAIAVPAYPPRLNRSMERLQAVAQDSQASLALTTAQILSNVEALLAESPQLRSLRFLATDAISKAPSEQWRAPDLDGDSIAFLQYTSGSTSAPRGVLVSHGNLLQNERMIQQAFRQTEESVIFSWLPLYHDMGLIGCMLQPLYAGARCILMSPMAFLQRPLRWLQAISRYRATTSGGPNFAYDLCARKVTAEQRASLDLSSWAVAFNGAEPVRYETLNRFAAAFEPCGFRRESFIPCYGLAEATLFVSGGSSSTAHRACRINRSELEHNRVVPVDDSDLNALTIVGCGQAALEQKVLIVDPGTLTPGSGDRVGEIWVSGPSVAQGYWDRPGHTAETFQARLAGSGGGPFLRTGDLGFIRDGELYVTGRIKDLIIIRGRNHYPQDIELTVEQSHPSLRPGSNAAFSVSVNDEERLVIVQEAGHAKESILDEAIENIRLAVMENHEAQVYDLVFIKAGTIPKTSSGKIQRHACRAMFLANTLQLVKESKLDGSPKTTFDADQGGDDHSVEALLMSLVAGLTGVASGQLNLDQRLSSLGLDSLRAVELSAEIENRLGVTVAPLELIRGPRLSQLASHIRNLLSERAGIQTSIKPVARTGNIPASFAQQRLWFLDQLVPESAFYNLPCAIRLAGELNTPALHKSLNRIIRRHETLRTSFALVGGQLTQVINQAGALNLPLLDLREISDATREEEARRIALQETRQPFDLSRSPLLRAILLRVGEREHVLIVTMHHIISDGWSIGVLLKELAGRYESYSKGREEESEELEIQYADYAVWQREWLEGEEMRRQMEYWKEELKEVTPVLEMPVERGRGAVQRFRGRREGIEIGGELGNSLKALSQSEGATLFMTLLAAFQVLLYRYTRQRDIIVGTVTHARSWPQIRNLIGFFANTLVIRAELSSDETFRELLGKAREVILAAFAHQDMPFEKLVEELRIDRNLSYTPLFQVMFILQNDMNAPGPEEDFAGVSMTRLHELEDTGTTKRDVSLYLMDGREGLRGLIEYDADLFDSGAIRRMTEHFQTLIKSIVANPDKKISELSMLSEEEYRNIIVEWNDTAARCDEHCSIEAVFEEQVERTPEGIAIMFEGESLTYQELNRRANQLAHSLRAFGISRESLVGICIRRSIDMVVAILGTLKAGAAYLPLDPAYPKQRLAFLLNNSQARTLIVNGQSAETLPEFSGPVISLDRDRALISQCSDENLATGQLPAELAYVIYTSGSTGESKGVMVSHANLCRYVQSLGPSIGIAADDRYLHTASFSFSSSVRQLMLPLSKGATVVIAASDQIADPLELFKLIKRDAVTIMDIVPAYWRSCVQALARLEPGARASLLDNRLRLLLSASEPLTSDIVKAWASFDHGARLVNMFGQTETTGIVATFPIRDEFDDAVKIVSIGRPIANAQVYVLDPSLQPVPARVPGEAYIGGSGVARGYLKRPDLTAERFIPNPFSKEPGARLYRTGDMARHLLDGNIEFLGRTDQQVKINGIRIEMSEVETKLVEHPNVRAAIVVAREHPPGNTRLIAYFTTSHLPAPTPLELRAFLKEKAPAYMIPAMFVALHTLPLTPNGKVDRQALPAPFDLLSEPDMDFIAPRNHVEQILAGIWAEVLGLERVGVADNFFDLGGHSLLATQVLSRVRDTFKQEIPVRKLFETPTVEKIAELIQRNESATADASRNRIKPLPRRKKSINGLSPAQNQVTASEEPAPLKKASPKD